MFAFSFLPNSNPNFAAWQSAIARFVVTFSLLIDQLQAGEFPGDQISGTGFTVFKVRVKNSDIHKGKSAGYRVIYQVTKPTSVLLLLIYTKSDQSDVAAADIQAVIKKFHQA